MGGNNAKPRLRSDIFHEYERSLKVNRQGRSEADFKATQWKKFLKKKLADPAYCDAPSWDIFKKPIEKWLNNQTCEISPSWLGHAEFFALHSSSKSHFKKRNLSLTPTDAKTFSFAKEDPAVHQSFSNKRVQSNSTPNMPLRVNSSASDNLPVYHRTQSSNFLTRKPSAFSRPSIPERTKTEAYDADLPETNTLIPSLDLELDKIDFRNSQQIIYQNSPSMRSAAEELKKFLRKELALKDHPITEMIKIFKNAYELHFFKSKVLDKSAISNSEELAKMMNESVLPVKKFLKLLREFTNLIYKEVIAVSLDDLDDEDENHNIIIDQLLCQLMFDDTKSLLYQRILSCLQEKCKEQIKYFSKIAATSGGKCLHQIDNQFKEKLMLLDSRVPYDTVIRTLHLLKKIPNPYMKKDYISTMEREMVDSILDEMAKKGHIEDIHLEPDDKFTIYTFCLMRSNYANIVVDISFIEEFTLHEETNQAYARFKGCLMDYILSGNFDRFMKAEEKIYQSGGAKLRRCCCQTPQQ